jgi:hypothetical protein
MLVGPGLAVSFTARAFSLGGEPMCPVQGEFMSFKRFGLLAASVFALAFGSLLATSGDADAHERRSVGAYNFVVGWLNEPALINQPNAVDLRVTRASDGSNVTGLEQTLKLQVKADDKTTDVQVRPRFNTPGAYDGRLLPTALGAYTFVITGTIEGQTVNETFTAGTGTFGLIEQGAAFPNELPTNQDLAERLVVLESAKDTGSDDSDTGMMVGIAGVILGALGLAAGGLALTKKSA